MEQLPSELELRSYNYDRLNAALEQHETNIETYQSIIQTERDRIEWIRAVIRAKQILDDASIPVHSD